MEPSDLTIETSFVYRVNTQIDSPELEKTYKGQINLNIGDLVSLGSELSDGSNIIPRGDYRVTDRTVMHYAEPREKDFLGITYHLITDAEYERIHRQV